MSKIIGLSLSLTLLLVTSVCCSQPLVRQTANGPVEGIERTSSLGQKYYSFRGIPYAEAPITGKDPYTGDQVDRRFKAPEPLKYTWSDNLKAYNYGDFCIPSTYASNDSGSVFTETRTSENCLHLNIYVPAGGSEEKTVIVWIHGGAFLMGNTDEMSVGPDFLLSEDNIVVTVQYRLGVFGFLDLATDEYSGNMGLKDQQLALKWIYENIESFSGNKNEILLFGESAGGASVSFQLLNEESRKYFNRVYAISSSSFTNYALTRADNLQQMRDFLKINNTLELIEYLKSADSQFLSTQYPLDFFKTLTAPWNPTIESPTAIRPFMTETPDAIYNSDKAPVIDTLLSFTSKEIILFRPNFIGKTDPLITENWQDSDIDLPFEGFNKSIYPTEYKQSLELLKNAYYPDTTNTSAVERGNIDLLSDSVFADSILKAVKLQANANKNTQKNTFFLRFSMDAGINKKKIENELKFDGTTHSDDLCYYFHCHMFDHVKLYDKHLEQKDATYHAIMRMVKIVTNFARTGNPSVEDDTPFVPCKSANEIYCQEISNEPKSSVTTNIEEQLHYDTWRAVEEIYENLLN